MSSQEQSAIAVAVEQQESVVVRCTCGASFAQGNGYVPGFALLYAKIRGKAEVDKLHPLTKPEIFSQEYCGKRSCPCFVEPSFHVAGTLRTMAGWSERNARKLEESDRRRREREASYKERGLAYAVTHEPRGLVNRVIAEAGEKHGYHPKKSKKRLPMAQRRIKTPKPKHASLPEGGKKKGKKNKGGDQQKKGGRRGKK